MLCGRGKWKEEKEMIAVLMQTRTAMTNGWVAARLGMGHEVSVTRHTIHPAANENSMSQAERVSIVCYLGLVGRKIRRIYVRLTDQKRSVSTGAEKDRIEFSGSDRTRRRVLGEKKSRGHDSGGSQAEVK